MISGKENVIDLYTNWLSGCCKKFELGLPPSPPTFYGGVQTCVSTKVWGKKKNYQEHCERKNLQKKNVIHTKI